MEGQLKRSKKLLAIRGLNANHNHDLKNIFKGAAIRASFQGQSRAQQSSVFAPGLDLKR